MNKNYATIIFTLLVITILIPIALAANNPGHDSLYVLRIGDNITGPINITGTLNAYSLQTATLMYGSGLDIQANGSLITPTKPTIQSAGNNLYLDSASGNIMIGTQAGTTNYVRIGTGSINIVANGTLAVTGNLNVTGNITAGGSVVCTIANGLCGGSSNGGSWANTTTTTSTALNVNITAGNLSIQSTYSMCFNANCSSRIYYNGSTLVIEGQ